MVNFSINISLLIFNDNKEVYLDFHLRVNDARTMLECALQDIGIIKIFNYHIEDALATGRLIEILRPYREASKSIYVYYQPQKYLQKKIRLFLDFLYQKLPARSKNINDKFTHLSYLLYYNNCFVFWMLS